MIQAKSPKVNTVISSLLGGSFVTLLLLFSPNCDVQVFSQVVINYPNLRFPKYIKQKRIFLKIISIGIQYMCQFLLYSKMNQLYIDPPCFQYFLFYWNIIALPCCVSFCQIVNKSAICIHIAPPFCISHPHPTHLGRHRVLS